MQERNHGGRDNLGVQLFTDDKPPCEHADGTALLLYVSDTRQLVEQRTDLTAFPDALPDYRWEEEAGAVPYAGAAIAVGNRAVLDVPALRADNVTPPSSPTPHSAPVAARAAFARLSAP